ncbi:hypothetical protein IQ217_09470 [Synechocystis salina LEGE 00031]|uniref:Hemolytic protein HlpA-like protein n=2 Tax=Synechocystis TaxID=1142 RepID=A0ABR9VSQ1_9SYNC|nr:hypothetical protein [Synechocystis salina LEGE 00041]MBE9254066.1 hypothetical protein [Synechocystis salina LEGE 00031]
MQTPVLFLVFNRLGTTKQVFEAIRQAQPPRIYVAADGPRENREGEAEKVQAVRDYVISNIDWDCEIKTLFRDKNLGCRIAVSGAIDWFFDNEEQGIILEDDCLPHPTFFQYCQDLLNYYRNDERIMVISGDNFQFGQKRGKYSYYFSCYNHCWGWASWRRAWNLYDHDMKNWEDLQDGDWLLNLGNKNFQKYWKQIFEVAYSQKIDSWAYRWTFTCWIQNGLTILPNVNLISNIGFSQDGTHTLSRNSPLANMAIEEIAFPLNHPPYVIRDLQADKYTQKKHINISLFKRVLVKIRYIFRVDKL